ncbi:hypothetical protein EYC80_008844 [Monilinia laxa]|uniref:Uncharacterized protein n=1 Tax=Monilinia laxa TaxID=61186 RepID=A0A5N6K1N3_MONLA|nr:hypothetical protein EYC80_008844 [Monilinia laxa]
MAPNLYLATRKMFRPDQWKVFNQKKTPSKVLLHQTTPVPGVYCVDETGKRFLVAIEPIIDRRDSERIFEDISTGNPPTTINDMQPVHYRVLRDKPEVRYCKILDRYMFVGELEKRWDTYVHRDGIISYMFRLDNPHLYVSTGYGKIGKNGEIPKPPKVPRYHKGIYEDLWSRDPVTSAYTRMKAGEAEKAKEMKEKGKRDLV